MKKEIENDEQKKAREVVEEIASTIAKLSRQVQAILDGRVKRESIVVLLAHSCKLPKWQIEEVLNAIVNMEKNHLKK